MQYDTVACKYMPCSRILEFTWLTFSFKQMHLPSTKISSSEGPCQTCQLERLCHIADASHRTTWLCYLLEATSRTELVWHFKSCIASQEPDHNQYISILLKSCMIWVFKTKKTILVVHLEIFVLSVFFHKLFHQRQLRKSCVRHHGLGTTPPSAKL